MKKFIPLVIILIFVIGLFGYYKYNQPHKETVGTKADFVLSASAMLQEFESDEEAANKLYLDKIIEVEGIVKSVNDVENGGSISLETGNEMSAIICEFESGATISHLKAGDKAKIKGFCTGKLMDIVLVRCSLD